MSIIAIGKHCPGLLFLLLLAACSGAGERTAESNSTPGTQQEQAIPATDTMPRKAADPFTAEKIQALGDSLVSYFEKRAGYVIRHHETTVDTSLEAGYRKLKVRVRTDTYKTNGLISYEIFSFPSKEQASDFFNDLKTQELLMPFGLNKRPNHIVLDSNLVIWHQLEHPYGHRVRELALLFNTVLGYRPASSNLDSVSGFSYCHCKDEQVDMTRLKGQWRCGAATEISRPKKPDAAAGSDCLPLSENDLLSLSEDSTGLNGKSYPSMAFSSIRLPDSRLFWKYFFHYLEEDGNEVLQAGFLKKLEAMKREKQKLTLYEIKLSNHCYLSVVQLEKGKTYLIADRQLLELFKP